jgi:hypothetical protein
MLLVKRENKKRRPTFGAVASTLSASAVGASAASVSTATHFGIYVEGRGNLFGVRKGYVRLGLCVAGFVDEKEEDEGRGVKRGFISAVERADRLSTNHATVPHKPLVPLTRNMAPTELAQTGLITSSYREVGK